MYRGRFAPSPTGLLHFGSLVAAMASYLEARRAHGAWLVRMEDVDRSRCQKQYAEAILTALGALGMESDEPVMYQTQRAEAYAAALTQLGANVYACSCSRKDLGGQEAYRGRCRNGPEAGKPVRSLRLKAPGEVICFRDAVQGWFCGDLAKAPGDFPLYRPVEDMYTYQLAVVVDDEAQGITHVVRGADLLDSTPRQIYLQRCLGYRKPHYLHIPVVVDERGQKLSKQNLAPAIGGEDAALVLWRGLEFLGQAPPAELRHWTLTAIWEWARQHWQRERIPRVAERPMPTGPY
jgi:glutamyl-Q tRNA(Asp) synthetase